MNDVPARMSTSTPAIPPVDCQRFLIHLLLDGILNEDFHFTPFSTISYLVPGLRANNVLAGKISVFMDLASEVGSVNVVLKASQRPELYDASAQRCTFKIRNICVENNSYK